jgi:hypothetical protein
MSKKIPIENFLKMSPDVPQYSDKNQHYLISGVNPTYYLDVVGGQEEQVAPLIASNIWQPFAQQFLNNGIDITPSNDSTYEFYAIDAISKIYGGVFTFGGNLAIFSQPSGGNETVGIGTGRVQVYNGQLLVITNPATSNKIYKAPVPLSSSTWSNFANGYLSGTFDPHYMENFLNFCMITNQNSKVEKIDGSFSTPTPGIDLGTGWSIKGLKNFNDKYLAIAGANGNFNSNYLFLWNGIDSRYNYSMKMAGKFVDMRVIDGILYVAVDIGNVTKTNTVIFYLKGTQLVPLINPQISKITTASDKGALFDFGNRLGLNLDSNDLLIYAKKDIGTEEFVLSTGQVYYKFLNSYNGYLLGIDGSTHLFFYDFTSTTFNQISYASQWIAVKNLQGLDIWYDSPPQSGTDKISVTVYGDGQDIIAGTQTITLDDITPTNQLNKKRTRLDVKGFAGDKCKIVLTTTNTGSWRPIIRGIDLITK